MSSDTSNITVQELADSGNKGNSPPLHTILVADVNKAEKKRKCEQLIDLEYAESKRMKVDFFTGERVLDAPFAD